MHSVAESQKAEPMAYIANRVEIPGILGSALESASSRCVTLLAPFCLPPENGDRQDRLPLT